MTSGTLPVGADILVASNRSRARDLKAFLVPKLHQLKTFFVAQGVIQFATFLSGLLLVRLLTVPDYAKYSVFYGISSSASILTDVGFSGTLVALVGNRHASGQVVADYVKALRAFRRQLFYVVAPILIAVFPVLTVRQNWPASTVAVLIACLLANVWVTGVASSYSAVLVVSRDRYFYYSAQTLIAALRLLLILAMWALNGLTLTTAIISGLICTSVSAAVYSSRARRLLRTQGNPSRMIRREIIQLGLPNVPNVIFFAFQGQITTFLITLFGHSREIASIGALSRVAQLFVLFSQVNPVLIKPYFAKLPADRVARIYISCLLVATGGVLLIVFAAMLWPGPLLSILGPNYGSLTREVVWIVASSGIWYLSSLLWTIHLARQFIYWWATWLNIAVITGIEAAFISHANLSTTRGVVLLGLATSAGGFAVNLMVGARGLTRRPCPEQFACVV